MLSLIMRGISVVLLCLGATGCFAMEFAGRVVGVLDGDTIDVLTASKDQIRVRLNGIDAPEKRQPFGNAAKSALSDLVFSEQVKVEWHKKTDRYGRRVGKVMLNGTDVNLKMIKIGMAWHFKKYEKEQWATDRKLYALAEEQAQMKQIGLWRDPHPVPPWAFRRPSP